MDGVARDEHKVVDGVFVVRLVVGDHGGERYLASRSRRRGNSDEQGKTTVYAQQTAHLVDRFARLRDARAHPLGAVHGRAATKADDGAAGVLAVQRSRLFHVGDRGVCLGICVNGAADSRLCKRCLERGRQTQARDAGVGHDQDALHSALLEHRRHVLSML